MDILYIPVARACRFLLWVKKELSFSNSSLNKEVLSPYTLFFIRATFCWASMFFFFWSIWASSVLIPVPIHSCSNKLQFRYLTITSHQACWKSRKFPFQKGKKEIFKNFPKNKSIVYNKFLVDSMRLLWHIFLFLTEHNPSFTLFLICSYFFYPIWASMFL